MQTITNINNIQNLAEQLDVSQEIVKEVLKKEPIFLWKKTKQGLTVYIAAFTEKNIVKLKQIDFGKFGDIVQIETPYGLQLHIYGVEKEDFKTLKEIISTLKQDKRE